MSTVPSYNKEDIVGYECKHAIYAESTHNKDDAVVVKEVIHLKDGRKLPNLRVLRNYKRDFWVTKPGYRNHKDKKEWEEITRVQKFSCTQRKLTDAIGKALGRPGMQGSLRQLARSPYLYGCDITTPVLVKNRYRTQWPQCIDSNRIAALDIETDVNHIEGDEIGNIISVGLSFQNRAVLAYTLEFLGTVPNVVEETHRLFDVHLGEYKKKRNIELEVIICDSPAHAVVEVFKRAHAWQPDFISIWNMNFDLPTMIRDLEREGVDPAEVFSDPRVPPEFRFYKYTEGPAQKVTASGKTMANHPADRWHVMECPASFYFIDAMCLYKKVRAAKGNEASYALDYILNKHLGVRKLKFDDILEREAPDVRAGSLNWHRLMQSRYRLEYGIYNLFDCISLELLDEKIGDLKLTVSILCEHSEYAKFPSQPRRTVDDLHFFCQEHGLVIGTTSDQMVEELDQYVLEMTDWIVTLPSHLVVDNGLKMIRELPNLSTSYRAHVADLDVSSSYPNTEDFCNISKATTWRELCKMKGIPEDVQRRAGINLTGGITNAAEICVEVFNAPTFDQLLADFTNQVA